MDDEDAPPTTNVTDDAEAEDGPAAEAAPTEEDDAPAREPVSLETALSWLQKTRPAAVLALLRDPDFALVSMTAFAGFRVGNTGYANPIVRKRLAMEAIRDDKFADKLQALAETAPPSPVSSPPAPPSLDEQTQKQTAAQEAEQRLAALRVERDQRRRERDDARQALASAEAARAAAERQQGRLEKERDDAQAQFQRQGQRLARLERQVTRLQAEQTDLLRALRHQAAESDSASHGRTEAHAPPNHHSRNGHADSLTDLWQTAVTHLLDKRRYDVVVSIAEDVLRTDPENLAALDVAARAHEAKGEPQETVRLLRRRLAASHLGPLSEAAETLLRLLLSAPPREVERDLRAFLAPIHATDSRQVEPVRAALSRLGVLSPDSHAQVAAMIEKMVPAALADALFPPPGQLEPNDPLPFDASWTPSARLLLQAVDTGDVGAVARARESLSRLARTSPDEAARIETALARAAGDDSAALVPLLGSKGRGPVVVDGSNAAWHGQDALAAGRPRLRPLLELRRVLRTRGYFPVVIYGDAPLPYTIDEPAALRRMVDRGEITLVDSGVDADEVLLREAKRLSAPLVTNDYMTDWDPWDEVPKIRYTLSHHGEAYLDD